MDSLRSSTPPRRVTAMFGGDDVRNSSDLVSKVRGSGAGKVVDITVVREGERKSITAKLSRRAANDNLR